MELHPTPESWRIALVTAAGSIVVAALAVFAVFAGVLLPAFWYAVVAAGAATFVPAVGTLTASVDASQHGVSVRRFGRTTSYQWSDIAGITVVERRASVPDGTEYHWAVPSRSKHVVAIPTLELADGSARELPALSSPRNEASKNGVATTEPAADGAHEYAATLVQIRATVAAAR